MKILIATEGGRDSGFGHITRCIALSQAFKEKGLIAEFIVKGDDSISNLLKGQRYRIFNWLQDREAALRMVRGADVVIIDSYAAELSFYEKVSRITKMPMYMDDTKRLPYPRGVLVNGAICADEMKYPAKKDITYFLGTEFTPLREVFWCASKKLIRKKIKNVLMILGGSDLRNMAPKILNFIKRFYPELFVTVVVGAGFRNVKEIKKIKNKNIAMVFAPDSYRLKKMMQASDIAISAGGQTLYELARIGLPTIAFTVIENQANNMSGWRTAGFIEDIGCWGDKDLFYRLSKAIELLSSQRERAKRSGIGSSLVDGKGAKRIVKALLN